MTLRLLLLFAFAIPALAQEPPNRSMDDLQEMEGFKKMIPKGRIPAIFKPEFIKAEETSAMPDTAWVIGVFHEGIAKAYSLNLLNRHEIVNDYIGDQPIAATW